MEDIKVYILDECSYCNTVLKKLKKLNIKYETYEVTINRLERTEIKNITGQRSVPVISDPNKNVIGMYGVSNILEYIEKEYGTRQHINIGFDTKDRLDLFTKSLDI